VRQHPRRGGIDFGVRDHVGVEHGGDRHVEPPVPAEQGQQPGAGQRGVDRQLPKHVVDAFRVGKCHRSLSPTVMVVPHTADGAERLAAELVRAHEVLDPPALVWLFDRDGLREVRALLYGWRPGAPPRALVVRHEPGPVDRIEWVCEPYVRPRLIE
jgi:hypothetical protein